MKRQMVSIAMTMVILLLLTGFVSANNDTPPSKINESIIAQQSSKPMVGPNALPSQQPDLQNLKKTLPPQRQQEIDKQVGYNNSINKAIEEKERQLLSTPLMNNDVHVISPEVNGFSVSRSAPPSPEVISAINGSGRMQVSSISSEVVTANRIPFNGHLFTSTLFLNQPPTNKIHL